MSFNTVVIGINAKISCFGGFQEIKLANNQIKPNWLSEISMKFKASSYFFIICILFLPIDAFADSVNISVDLPIFTDTDKIVIYGNISTETTLQIIITDPDLNSTCICFLSYVVSFPICFPFIPPFLLLFPFFSSNSEVSFLFVFSHLLRL